MRFRLFWQNRLFDRYTSEVRRAVFYGNHFAKHEGLTEISNRHLLIGIDREAPFLLPFVGLSQAGLSWLREPTRAPSRSGLVPEAIPLAESAKVAVRTAGDIAERNDNFAVEMPHFLAAVIQSDPQLKSSLLGYNLAESKVEEACKNPAIAGRRFIRRSKL